jgi:predicted GTPase
MANPQITTILKGVRDLENILTGSLAANALRLDEDAATTSRRDLLVRVRKSLVQYQDRTQELFYAAFVGHFNAGKSSTINSLLNLWNTSDAREDSLSPTDKHISLITHEANIASLVIGFSEDVRLAPLKNEFLKHLVLVDTPGTGDPHLLLKELSRDFLPVCDIVLFFFSATNTLDTTDVPILTELRENLDFIPLLFVVTRADELRLDMSSPVSMDNINKQQQSVFLSRILTRLRDVFPNNTITEGSFIFVDNRAAYNIETLRDALLSRADPARLSSRLEIATNRIAYFQRRGADLKNYFAGFIDLRLQELTRVVEASGNNIKHYHASVTISNNNLTKSWFDLYIRIKEESGPRCQDHFPAAIRLWIGGSEIGR